MFRTLFSCFDSIQTYFWQKFVYWWHWNKSSNWKAYLACIYMTFRKDCWERFVSMLHLCVCRSLLHFVSILTIYAVERNVVAYCHAHIYKVTDHYWQTGLNESVLHFEVVFVVCWRQIRKIVRVFYLAVSLILPKIHKNSS